MAIEHSSGDSSQVHFTLSVLLGDNGYQQIIIRPYPTEIILAPGQLEVNLGKSESRGGEVAVIFDPQKVKIWRRNVQAIQGNGQQSNQFDFYQKAYAAGYDAFVRSDTTIIAIGRRKA